MMFFFFQAEDGIRGTSVTGVQTCALPISGGSSVGSLDPPIPVPGAYSSTATVSITAGATTSFNITLQGTQPRFDAFESASLLAPYRAIWLRGEQLIRRRQTT